MSDRLSSLDSSFPYMEGPTTAMHVGAALAAAPGTRPNPLDARLGRQRRYATASGALDDHKATRKQHGGIVNAVTDVPDPEFPLYVVGARMREMYPVVPRAKGQTVAIGVIPYDGCVCFGLNADRDAMGDVDPLADAISGSSTELRATVS